MGTIKDIITKYYCVLTGDCHGDKVISQGRTEDDIFQDVCVTAMRKYKDQIIDEQEGLSYLKKTIYTEKHFQVARLKKEIVIYTDNLEDIADH